MSVPTKHTPGPWRVEKRPANGVKWPVIVHDRGATVIGGNSDWDPHTEEDVFFLDAYDADVQLAAAAPELLEACKAAFDHLDGCSHGYPPDLWDQLEDAIIKAEGG